MYLILTGVRSWMVWPALFLACVSAYSLQAKDLTPPAGISPDKVADFVHAVLDADRTIYTNQVVNRMQAKGIVSAVEHWEHENALPLPAQFLQHSGKLVAESGRGIRYRLISLWPIYQRNAPATELERRALESFAETPDRPFTGIVTSGRKQFFQAIYSDRATSASCVKCHNSHPLSPKRDFALNDVIGGMTITIPLD
ncbi:MAG: DUF3365 domain-containing protein [Nitrospira sp.]|nr:DUF3365 domain-containing protein [Nitrospira sp.]